MALLMLTKTSLAFHSTAISSVGDLWLWRSHMTALDISKATNSFKDISACV